MNADLADRLKRAREAWGHSQAQAAQAIGVTPSTVSHWEQGVQLPRNQAIRAALDRYLRGRGAQRSRHV